MAMQKREKILAIITGALLVVFLLVTALTGSGGSATTLQGTLDALGEEIKSKKKTVDLARNSIKQIADWRNRSLPSDRENARSLYQDWLRSLVGKAGFREVRVDSSDGRSLRGVYTMITFTVNGEATIEQLTRFLFDFYSAGHLHKVRHLSMTPIKDSQEMSIAITVEALSMPGADRADKLSEESSERLESAEVEDYLAAIAKRKLDAERDPVDGGLFTAYRPPRPPYVSPPPRPDPPKPPRFDPTTVTFLNAVVEVDGRAQAWFFIRSSNETMKYHEDDEFEIGPIRGTVERVDASRRTVELNVRGRTVRLVLGDNLNERLPDDLPEEEPDEPEPADEATDEELDELLDELEKEAAEQSGGSLVDQPIDKLSEDEIERPEELKKDLLKEHTTDVPGNESNPE